MENALSQQSIYDSIPPKTNTCGSGNQGWRSSQLKEFFIPFSSTSDSVDLEYVFLKRETLPPGNTINGFIKWELRVYELVFCYCCNTNLVFLSNTNYCTVLSKSVDWKRILSRCFVTKNDLGKRKGCKPGQADTLSYMHNSDLHAKIKGCLYEGKRKLREGEVRPIELYYKHRILPIGSCDYVVWELLPWALALPTDTPNWLCLF